VNTLVEWTGGGGDPDLGSRLELTISTCASDVDFDNLTLKMVAEWTVKSPWLYQLFSERWVLSFSLGLSDLIDIPCVRATLHPVPPDLSLYHKTIILFQYHWKSLSRLP